MRETAERERDSKEELRVNTRLIKD